MGYQSTVQSAKLNLKQRRFLKLYTGKSDIAGNATRCYMAAYGQTNEFCAQRSGSKLTKHPRIAAILAKAEADAIEELKINAGFVLNESLRMYRRAMGDESVELVESTVDPDTGQDRVHVRTITEYDPATAHKALQSIGAHKDVQAYSVTVEHNHTHHLEQRLAARSALIEGKASSIDDPPAAVRAAQLDHADPADHTSAQVVTDPTDPHAPGASVEHAPAPATRGNDDHAHADAGGDAHAPTAGAGAERVHRAEVNDERAREPERTSAESAGQRAE